jgi:hypothetical protein
MMIWDFVILTYFTTHIPATLIIDAQAALPSLGIQHPQFAVDLLNWYCQQYADPCMCSRPPWFVAIVCFELLFQLPFFFVVLWAWPKRASWLRIPMICYGAHTATTLVPIFGELFSAPLQQHQLIVLCGFYLPYFCIPLALMWFAAKDQLFSVSESRAKRS